MLYNVMLIIKEGKFKMNKIYFLLVKVLDFVFVGLSQMVKFGRVKLDFFKGMWGMNF